MYINVVKSPFFAVTDKSGKYEIKGLPPGDYTLAFVQEKLGEQDQKVTVAPKDSKTVDTHIQGGHGRVAVPMSCNEACNLDKIVISGAGCADRILLSALFVEACTESN